MVSNPNTGVYRLSTIFSASTAYRKDRLCDCIDHISVRTLKQVTYLCRSVLAVANRARLTGCGAFGRLEDNPKQVLCINSVMLSPFPTFCCVPFS
jgi:hypothetical protein